MGIRIALGLVLVAAMVGIFMLDHVLAFPWGFTALCAVAGVLALREGARLIHAQAMQSPPSQPSKLGVDHVVVLAVLLSMLAFVAFGSLKLSTSGDPEVVASALIIHVALTIAVSTMLVPIAVSVRAIIRARTDPDTTRAGGTLAGTLLLHGYVSIPVVCMLGLRLQPGVGEWLVIWLIGVCRLGSDSCAYFAGKAFGRHKLIPNVSPGKTVEGLIGGMLGSVAVGGVLWWSFDALKAWHDLPTTLGLSLAIGLVATVGDLVESALKRGAGTKDSGAVLPAFGGVLDVIDGFLLAAPLTFALVLFERMAQ